MKLDKIKFARVIALIAGEYICVHDGLIEALDTVIDVDVPDAPVAHIDVAALHTLMAYMQEGQRKIEAIKQHRAMTGYGLKESKDIVEKYWPNPGYSKADLKAKVKAANYQNDTEYNNIMRFIENL